LIVSCTHNIEKPPFMELTAVIPYKGALAHYSIRSNAYSVFETILSAYEGVAANQPPSFFLMLKNGTRWMSSLEEEVFTEELGKAIELATQN
jgi:hypothetical protein